MTQRPESPYRRFFTEDRSFAQLVRRKEKPRPDTEKDPDKEPDGVGEKKPSPGRDDAPGK